MVQAGQSHQAWPWRGSHCLRAQGAPLSQTAQSSLEGTRGQLHWLSGHRTLPRSALARLVPNEEAGLQLKRGPQPCDLTGGNHQAGLRGLMRLKDEDDSLLACTGVSPLDGVLTGLGVWQSRSERGLGRLGTKDQEPETRALVLRGAPGGIRQSRRDLATGRRREASGTREGQTDGCQFIAAPSGVPGAW